MVKIWELARRGVAARGASYDLVVLRRARDRPRARACCARRRRSARSPASGRSRATGRARARAARATRRACAYLAVAQGTEMAVTETLELQRGPHGGDGTRARRGRRQRAAAAPLQRRGADADRGSASHARAGSNGTVPAAAARAAREVSPPGELPARPGGAAAPARFRGAAGAVRVDAGARSRRRSTRSPRGWRTVWSGAQAADGEPLTRRTASLARSRGGPAAPRPRASRGARAPRGPGAPGSRARAPAPCGRPCRSP